MAPEDGQGHSRDGSKSITLDNPANSNKPNNKENKHEIEEENNPMMQMLQQIIENQREAKETTEILRNDIRKIQNSHQEIIETVNQATAKAEEAQTTADEAKTQSKDNNLKINKVEKDIKTIKAMQQETNNYKDETMEEIKITKQSVEQNKKEISIAHNKIEDIYTSIDTISRELAAKTAANISVDNPDNPDPLAITDVDMIPLRIQQQTMTKEEQEKQMEKQRENKTKYILDIAKKRVGLKPVGPDHISHHAKNNSKTQK